jgi:hypothetical protein
MRAYRIPVPHMGDRAPMEAKTQQQDVGITGDPVQRNATDA